jgi:hypothetical protein
MKEQPQKHRQIVEEPRFVAELKAIEHDTRKADEFIDAAKWVLSREPEAGTRIGNTHVFFLPVANSPVVDQVVLYYTYDSESVYFLSISKTIYPPPE